MDDVGELMSDAPKINVSKIETNEHYCFDVDPIDIAKEKGCRAVFPKPNQLQIDLDSEEAKEEFLKRLEAFVFIDAHDLLLTPSQKAGHYHATLTFPFITFTEWERICLEGVLGDDPVRFYLNAKFLHNGVYNHSCLFEKYETLQKEGVSTQGIEEHPFEQ
jgi:hypothetical protein